MIFPIKAARIHIKKSVKLINIMSKFPYFKFSAHLISNTRHDAVTHVMILVMWKLCYMETKCLIKKNKTLSLLTQLLRSSHRRCSVKKVVLRNFAKFT